MKTWTIIPTKNQAILICSLMTFLFLRLLVITDFLTSDKFSNRQYLIYGVLMATGFAISIASIVIYRAKTIDKSN
jgi:hypothetical protein